MESKQLVEEFTTKCKALLKSLSLDKPISNIAREKFLKLNTFEQLQKIYARWDTLDENQKLIVAVILDGDNPWESESECEYCKDEDDMTDLRWVTSGGFECSAKHPNYCPKCGRQLN